MHRCGVGDPSSKVWNTRRGIRTTPSYSPTPMPNSTAARSAFHRASGGNRKNIARPPGKEALCSLIVLSHGAELGNSGIYAMAAVQGERILGGVIGMASDTARLR